jgi:Rod binding domain-containing protein
MNDARIDAASAIRPQPMATAPATLSAANGNDAKLREAFDSFVGETFYSQMLKSMRELTGKPPYFHGGQAEEIFRDQLDQILAQEFTQATANQFTGPMFELFQLHRR